jgi:hypothetical protein
MKDSKSLIWLLAVAITIIAVGCLLYSGILHSGSTVRDTPLMRELSRIHELSGKLTFYADEHSAFAEGEKTGKSVEGLVAAGILSPEDAAYIHDNHIEFRGFDPAKIGADIAVFVTIFTNTSLPRRIVGYSDGSTVMYDLGKTQ